MIEDDVESQHLCGAIFSFQKHIQGASSAKKGDYWWSQYFPIQVFLQMKGTHKFARLLVFAIINKSTYIHCQPLFLSKTGITDEANISHICFFADERDTQICERLVFRNNQQIYLYPLPTPFPVLLTRDNNKTFAKIHPGWKLRFNRYYVRYQQHCVII